MFKLKIDAGRWGEGIKKTQSHGKQKAGRTRAKTMHTS